MAKAPFNAQQAKEFQQQWSKHIGKPVVEANSIGMKMILVPPGEYTMGRGVRPALGRRRCYALWGPGWHDPCR